MPPQNERVNPAFSILPHEIDAAESNLLIEAGPAGISLLVLTGEKHFSALVSYTFSTEMDNDSIALAIEKIFHDEQLLKINYKKVNIIWTFPDALAVPNDFMQSANAPDMLDLVYGNLQTSVVRSDFDYKQNLHIVYRIPSKTADVFSQHALFGTQAHQYSLLPDIKNAVGNELFVIFYQSRFTVMLNKDGKLQAFQNHRYQSPDDVAYHLLNVCRSFGVDITDVKLNCSGMIDTNSSLFEALYRYFPEINCLPIPEAVTYQKEFGNYPSHFFSHLFYTALCV